MGVWYSRLAPAPSVMLWNIDTHTYKIQKHFQNVMLASETSKNYTYKCVDRSRHNGIKGAKAKCVH